jgi:Trk-type K+ transport systems, membrane components
MYSLKTRYPGAFLVSYYTGYVVTCIALLMAVPLVTSLVMGEFNPALDFLISMSVTLLTGTAMMALCGREVRERVQMQWKHGFIAAALTWILLMFLCAIPYMLSGHSQSLLDACFDVMSGFTTTGLVLTQDLDHISVGLNMWRHILTFVGGQGMVVLALSFLMKNIGGAYKFYVGEAKDIGLAPNVKGTARIIWKISMIYLVVGTAALWICGIVEGMSPLSAFFNGLFMFESSWSTGGFAPYSQNIMYFHSLSYEVICLIIFVLGSFNFGLHYAVWQGKKAEFIKNIETQSFFITSFLACVFGVLYLSKTGMYKDAVSMFRRVVFSIISAHTTTGLGSTYARQFAHEWGSFGILIMVIVMMIGGSACSTAGGFKGLRVGIVVKALIADVKKLLAPERNVKVSKYHHIRENVLDDGVVRSSALIIICYIVMFTISTGLGTIYGYPLGESAFEAASVAGNVGLSIGVTTASMPALLKVQYIISMYLGRLEFLSVFALAGMIIGGIGRLCKSALSRLSSLR